jgi:cytochrome c-type biogenesis protein
MIDSTVAHGPLLFAVALAMAAGLLSFLSPCILPLVPGYISYVTGLAGADLDAGVGIDPAGRAVPAADATATTGDATATTVRSGVRRRVRGRVLAGSGLFVLGFAVVYTLAGTAASGAGVLLSRYESVLQRIVGVLIILMGAAFLGAIPGLQNELRVRWLPTSGLFGAPLFGAVFALSWIPCTGPTLAAVLGLASVQGSVGRGAILTLAYCLGLGIPFILFGLGIRRLLGALRFIRRHSLWVTRVGGAMLVIVGLLLVSGQWDPFLRWLTAWFPAGVVLPI